MKELLPFLKVFMVSIFGWTGIQKFLKKKFLLGTLFLLSLGCFFVGWVFDVCSAYNDVKEKMQ